MLSPAIASALPGDILFSDDFERASLAPNWTTTDANRSAIGSQTSNSPTRSLYTRYDIVTTTSSTINLNGKYAQIEMWIRRGADAFSEDTDAGEDLYVEYLNSSNVWSTLASYPGSGVNGEVITLSEQLPANALHSNFSIRFRQTGGSGVGYDYWHIDDVIVTETGYVAPPPPLAIGECDYFEGTLSNWTINQVDGQVFITNATALSPTNSLSFNGGAASATSIPIDTSSNFQDLTIWVRRGDDSFSENPEGSENMILEYYNSSNNWITLETFTGTGTPGEIFNRTYTMPADAKHANFRVRLSQTSGSGVNFDYWHIDDVCLTAAVNFPTITMQKSSVVQSDGINASNPKRIPGAIVEYTITVTNSGDGVADNNTIEVNDAIPANTTYVVNSLQFIDGTISSGLTAGPSEFSYSVDGTNYNSTQSTATTNLRISPLGEFQAASGAGNPYFDIKFQVEVN